MGLFINWQGMTGIVTKCAVQLWPKKKIETALLAIVNDAESTAAFIRELGRLELVDDISAVSVEVAKMALGLPKPPKFEKEPMFSIIIPISAHNKKHLEVKREIIQDLVNKLNKKYQNTIQITDFDYFAACVGEKVRVFRDLPGVITPLVEYSGLTWVGTYAPPENLGSLITDANELFTAYDIPAFIYMKSMKASHYAIFRPIIRYKKELEEARILKFIEDMLEICLKHGCIPYKTPIWVSKRLQQQIDPNWFKFFKEVKHFMDPKGIFNPGRWGI
jgi:glycolate oxidase